MHHRLRHLTGRAGLFRSAIVTLPHSCGVMIGLMRDQKALLALISDVMETSSLSLDKRNSSSADFAIPTTLPNLVRRRGPSPLVRPELRWYGPRQSAFSQPCRGFLNGIQRFTCDRMFDGHGNLQVPRGALVASSVLEIADFPLLETFSGLLARN